MKTRRIFSAILYLFIIQAFTQWGGVMLAQCTNSDVAVWQNSGANVGIHINNPLKPLHIFSQNICPDACIRLENQLPYWGHLALLDATNTLWYSNIGQQADMILQADTNAGNVLISARNKGKAIKFSTTTSNSLPNTFFDYERFRISEDGYNTMVDIKVPELVPSHGSPILRFQRLQPNGLPLPSPGNKWNMGIDVNDSVTAFKFGAMDSTCALFDDTRSFTFSKEGNLGIGTGNPMSPLQISKNQSSMNYFIDTADQANILSSKPDEGYPTKWCLWDISMGCELKFKFQQSTVLGDQITKTLPEANTLIVFKPNGMICAKEVRVQLSGAPCWGDYVFDENYQLMPLHELESTIKDNKHLPGVPTAKELESNGLQIGEMQSIMMKKIEELTLYVIDLQKQCNVLKKQLSDKNNGEE